MSFTFVIEALFLLIWFITSGFIVLSIAFRKRKAGRWIFGGLAVVFGILPFILSGGFERTRLEQQDQFIGFYKSNETSSFLILNKDLSWTSDSTLFECSSGRWKYITTEDMSYLELSGDCENGHTFLQIYNCNSDQLIFSLDQNTGNTKSAIELRRH